MPQQTIFHTNPERLGNCYAACVAEFLHLDIDQVPHFVEQGIILTQEPGDTTGWWALSVGFMWAHHLTPVRLDSLDDAESGEIVFASGPSPRGVPHQVLYRDGALYFDPHPSCAGITEVTEVMRYARVHAHNHDPNASHDDVTRALFDSERAIWAADA